MLYMFGSSPLLNHNQVEQLKVYSHLSSCACTQNVLQARVCFWRLCSKDFLPIFQTSPLHSETRATVHVIEFKVKDRHTYSETLFFDVPLFTSDLLVNN